MSAATCVTATGGIRLGVMVRTACELFVYWSLTGGGGPPALHVTDLSGRPPAELLDGTGVRECAIEPGAGSVYLRGLLPGHLYLVELGGLAAGPVQTPGASAVDRADFPSPYHRS